jgi:hypothetical protein
MFINIIFHFLIVKNGIFCEASTTNMMQNDTHPIITQSRPYFIDNPAILGIFSVSTSFRLFK